LLLLLVCWSDNFLFITLVGITSFDLLMKKDFTLIQSTPVEGGIRVCDDAVMCYFWRGFLEIFIVTCSIAVL